MIFNVRPPKKCLYYSTTRFFAALHRIFRPLDYNCRLSGAEVGEQWQAGVCCVHHVSEMKW